MKQIAIVGVILILLGVGGLFFGHFSFTQTKPVVDAGPIHINSEEHHTVWIPTAAGIVSVLAGLGLVVLARRST